jgi:hypothetical protein
MKLQTKRKICSGFMYPLFAFGIFGIYNSIGDPSLEAKIASGLGSAFLLIGVIIWTFRDTKLKLKE